MDCDVVIYTLRGTGRCTTSCLGMKYLVHKRFVLTRSTVCSPLCRTGSYDTLYHHGLVLYELASRVPPRSNEQMSLLQQVGRRASS